jgi:hypothetical protein
MGEKAVRNLVDKIGESVVIAPHFNNFTQVFKYTITHIVTRFMLHLATSMPILHTYEFLFTFI